MAKKILILGMAMIMALGLFAGCWSNNGEIVENEPFYSLQAAYNKGFITKRNLKSIANFHKNGNAGILDDELANEIKAAYFESYPFEGYHEDDITIDDVRICVYYGTYDGFTAIMIDYKSYSYTGCGWNETIDGIKFEYGWNPRILIYKNK